MKTPGFFARFKMAIESGKEPVCDMCKCSECGWEGKVSDAIVEWESESWENPTEYEVVYCPVCEDGGMVDDFWNSKDKEVK